MCGILGWVSFGGAPVPVSALEEGLRRLSHRGPDHSGVWEDRGVWLGHRRLSILDLSPSGNQPMVNKDGRHIIVYNGEFYNYREHILLLRRHGISLSSTSDTEVLLELYGLLGARALEFVNGMFAFAIWDNLERRLFLARDRFGEKPLYFSQTAERICFASELKALYPLMDDLVLDGQAVDSFFSFGYVPAPLSIVSGIRKLEAAHCLSVQEGVSKKNRYWELSPPNGKPATEEEVRVALSDSIRLRFTSDVPVGVLLSGGIDSSLIAVMASEMGLDFTAFCMGGGQGWYDERPYASRVAELCHRSVVVDSVDSSNVVGHILETTSGLDEPFADSSAVPSYHLFKLAAREGKVVLSGEGGDELFGGYDKYRRALRVRAFRRLPSPIRSLLNRAGDRVDEYRPSFWKSLTRAARHSLASDVEVFCAFNSMLSPFFKRCLLTEDFWKRYGRENADYFRIHEDQRLPEFSVSKMMDLDRRTYLAEDLMVKADRMSMAASLEVRCPFLDHRLVEISLRLKEQDLILKNQGKVLLRRLASRYLPPEIAQRPKKGFSVPVSDWLRGAVAPLFDEIVRPNDTLVEILDYKEIARRRRLHQASAFDFTNHLWALLVFHLWWEQFGRPLGFKLA